MATVWRSLRMFLPFAWKKNEEGSHEAAQAGQIFQLQNPQLVTSSRGRLRHQTFLSDLCFGATIRHQMNKWPFRSFRQEMDS